MNTSLLRTLHIAGLSLVAAVAQAADPTDQAADTSKSAAPSSSSASVSVTRPVEKIDINTADAATLQRLPGVTEEIAAAIIKARPFKNVDELAKVDGMGEARVAILKSQLVASSTSSTTDEPALTPTGRDNPDDQKKPAADAATPSATPSSSTPSTTTPSTSTTSPGATDNATPDKDSADKNEADKSATDKKY